MRAKRINNLIKKGEETACSNTVSKKMVSICIILILIVMVPSNSSELVRNANSQAPHETY